MNKVTYAVGSMTGLAGGGLGDRPKNSMQLSFTFPEVNCIY